MGLGYHVPAGLIYAGRAGGIRAGGKASTSTLWDRLVAMQLGGSRNFSTFRLTLTACLTPVDSVPIPEHALTEWMQRHLRVAVLPLAIEDVNPAERRLLQLADPPLNLQDVEPTPLRQALRQARSRVAYR